MIRGRGSDSLLGVVADKVFAFLKCTVDSIGVSSGDGDTEKGPFGIAALLPAILKCLLCVVECVGEDDGSIKNSLGQHGIFDCLFGILLDFLTQTC